MSPTPANASGAPLDEARCPIADPTRGWGASSSRSRGIHARIRGLAALLLALLPAVAPAADGPDLLKVRPGRAEDCDALIRDYPGSGDAYRCYLFLAQRLQDWSAAVQGLEARLAADPDDGWALLMLGRLEADRGRERAPELLRQAARELGRSHDVAGLVESELTLAHSLESRGAKAEADRALERARDAARASDDVDPAVLVHLSRSRIAYWREDFAAAAEILTDPPPDVLDRASPAVRASVISQRGTMEWVNGRLESAADLFAQAAGIYAAIGDPFLESTDRYNEALVLGRLRASGAVTDEQVTAAVDRALRTAVEGHNPYGEASVRLLLAQMPGQSADRCVEEARRALELLRDGQDRAKEAFASRLLARTRESRDGDAAADEVSVLLGRSLELARSLGSLSDEARTYIQSAGLGRGTRPRAEVIADYANAIEAIERLRDLQSDDLVRARFVWDWAFAYHRMAGYLLDPPGTQPDPADAELAFRTIERLRSRALLDAMDRAGAHPAAAAANRTEQAERERILSRIGQLQRELQGPGIEEQERSELLAELATLEAAEVDLRRSIAARDPDYALMRAPSIPSLAEVQRALAPDEALLAFHLSNRERAAYLEPNGGSWVFAISAQRVHVEPVADRAQLEDWVTTFVGLIERRDALARQAAARLYGELLGPALDALGPGVRRLVVVPDGILYDLPLGALRPEADAPPLAATRIVSEVPSVTQWFQGRTGEGDAVQGRALALADPALSEDAVDRPDALRQPRDPADVRVVPLPRAQIEARSLAEALGRDSRVLLGGDASEHALKTMDLRAFGILHFATHAWIDPERPEKSAVLLAPGSPYEDGLLQLREIVNLDLANRVVILSACSSVKGEPSGEGVIGLARGFFQAGSRAVVGSLWPQRDDEAELLVRELARNLGEGQSLGEALTQAQRARVAAGAPDSAWAGLVLLGDADLRLAPEAPARFRIVLGAGLVGLAVLALLVLVRIRRRGAG